MKITLRYGEQQFVVDVSENIYLALDENRRKAENLNHEKRRHWDARAFDENIVASESCLHHSYMATPEEAYFRKEKFKAIHETLATCTPVQRERFLLHALDGLSFAEIARRQGCSKYAIRDSVEAVRKKLQKILED